MCNHLPHICAGTRRICLPSAPGLAESAPHLRLGLAYHIRLGRGPSVPQWSSLCAWSHPPCCVRSDGSAWHCQAAVRLRLRPSFRAAAAAPLCATERIGGPNCRSVCRTCYEARVACMTPDCAPRILCVACRRLHVARCRRVSLSTHRRASIRRGALGTLREATEPGAEDGSGPGFPQT